MKTTKTISKSLITAMLMFLFVSASFAADKTVTMKVGETMTLYLPSSITSKAIKGSTWTSTRNDEIEVLSQTSYSVRVKAIKSVPSTTTCLIHCQYYYYESRGTFTYMRTGIYDIKIETIPINPVSISLPSSVSIIVGRSKNLTATITPTNAETELTWSSSNSSIITVSQEGRIVAKDVGTSVIKVKTSNGLTASCSVTASMPVINVTSITVTPSTYDIEVGKLYTLVATVLPVSATDKTVSWSSNAPAIVSVNNNGQITGLSEGNAIITAKSANGKSATCKVLCKPSVQEIEMSDNEGLAVNVPSIANVKYERTFYEGWNSLCLPFDISEEILGLHDAKIAVFGDIETIGNTKRISYKLVDHIERGTPCMIYVPITQVSKVDLKEVSLTNKPNNTSAMKGSFSDIIIGSGCYKITQDGKSFALTKCDEAMCKAFRAYIKE